ncbi:MAG: YfiM family protein [Gammaproteobacteria bacterium]|nr:YfiM family protein [Gammaproteobacteria bacterium]
MQTIISKNSYYALLLLFFAAIHDAHALLSDCTTESPWQEQKQDIINANLTGIGVVTIWGVANWDYFTSSPKSTEENWFQNDTSSGGADKIGHMYTSYVSTHGLSYLYETWCINKDDAALYGALSSLAILGYMEVGDSFSDYGFSNEDFIANSIGSLLGYYLYINPDIASKIDLRLEYGIHPNNNDLTTDYENHKYLLALKLNGFEYFRNSFMKHIELQVGYYSRGFDDPLATRERNLFFGIGLNLTDLFRRHSYKKTATVLRYIQIPGTNIEFNRDINK